MILQYDRIAILYSCTSKVKLREGHPLARDTIGASPSPTSPRGHLATHPPAGWQGSNGRDGTPPCSCAARPRWTGLKDRLFGGIQSCLSRDSHNGVTLHTYIYILGASAWTSVYIIMNRQYTVTQRYTAVFFLILVGTAVLHGFNG